MDSKHLFPVAATLLERNFSTEAPNITWVSDITCIDTVQGAVSGYFSGSTFHARPVGLKNFLSSQLVVSALSKAIKNRLAGAGLMVHFDFNTPVMISEEFLMNTISFKA